MKNLPVIITFLFISFLLNSCKNGNKSATEVRNTPEIKLVDPAATPQTKALYENLLKYRGKAMMFGHQDDLAYGLGGWGGEFRSDVNDVVGTFPAVFGWDAGEIGQKRNIDSVLFSDMRVWIIGAYQRGGINTLSWHLDNPVTGGDAWDCTPAVHDIIPGGDMNEDFKVTLDKLADFLLSLKTDKGVYVPVIFRPWHELNGSWFWWGRDHCTTEDFKALFRFTVEYLRDVRGVHHLLYAYSTDRFATEDEYMERFPGEDYVDLLGYDDYHSFAEKENIDQGINSLRILAELSGGMNKPFALTETGLESIPIATWWTEYVLDPIKADTLASQLSYMLVWRNANIDHHYAPYPGQISAANFMEFRKDPFTWFLEDLPDMYLVKGEKK